MLWLCRSLSAGGVALVSRGCYGGDGAGEGSVLLPRTR